jgi:hypothetical protein
VPVDAVTPKGARAGDADARGVGPDVVDALRALPRRCAPVGAVLGHAVVRRRGGRLRGGDAVRHTGAGTGRSLRGTRMRVASGRRSGAAWGCDPLPRHAVDAAATAAGRHRRGKATDGLAWWCEPVGNALPSPACQPQCRANPGCRRQTKRLAAQRAIHRSYPQGAVFHVKPLVARGGGLWMKLRRSEARRLLTAASGGRVACTSPRASTGATSTVTASRYAAASPKPVCGWCLGRGGGGGHATVQRQARRRGHG